MDTFLHSGWEITTVSSHNAAYRHTWARNPISNLSSQRRNFPWQRYSLRVSMASQIASRFNGVSSFLDYHPSAVHFIGCFMHGATENNLCGSSREWRQELYQNICQICKSNPFIHWVSQCIGVIVWQFWRNTTSEWRQTKSRSLN